MVLWESDRKYSLFDEIWQTRHFWEQTSSTKEKDRQIIRICRIHQLHLIPGKGFWFYGNLTGNIRDLTGLADPTFLGTHRPGREKRIGKYQNL